MKLSISNIAWSRENDAAVYNLMRRHGFEGLEIAPSRIFPDEPYLHAKEAAQWAREIFEEYGFSIPSMQSIWFGRTERLFGTESERQLLMEYTKKAIDFAQAVGCKNLVFGCPRNRSKPDGVDDQIALNFFREIGDYAGSCGTGIGFEANPPIYHTNYVNRTEEALTLIERVNSGCFGLNLDLGTVIYNQESLSVLYGKWGYVRHVHISEPELAEIKERPLHRKLFSNLREQHYCGFVSMEVKRQKDLGALEKMMQYVAEADKE